MKNAVTRVEFGPVLMAATLWLVGCSAESTTDTPTENPTETMQEAPVAPDQAPAEDTTRLTGPQRNAVRSANQYLSISGFSRDGLIAQLSSDFGDGYEVADATAAVDSLDVDWNEHAARSAQQYLSISGFSCKGLIDQLSSSAGDKYTRSQAEYGAQQAGAC